MRDSQLATFLPSDKVVLVEGKYLRDKTPEVSANKNLDSAGNRWTIRIYVLNVSFPSRDNENLACRVSLTATRYIFPCASCRASAMRVFMRAAVQRGEREKGEENGDTRHSSLICVYYWRIIQTAGTTLDCLDCHVGGNLVLTSYFRSAKYVSAPIVRARACVVACVHLSRSGSLTKSRVPYLRKCTTRMKETREESR